MTRLSTMLRSVGLAVLALAGLVAPASAGGLSGLVASEEGRPLAGVWVSARRGGVARTVLTDARGRYRIEGLAGGEYLVEARRAGYAPARRERVPVNDRESLVNLTLAPSDDLESQVASAAWLALLPENEEKRRFVLDCTGCHQFDGRIVEPGGERRSESSWRERIAQMLQFAGWRTPFPIISAGRDPDSTAAWLTRYLNAGGIARVQAPALPRPETARARITEYDLPRPSDLPHDLALDPLGRVLVTGMFSHVIYALDPATGAFEETPIPVPDANPRAIELADDGAWWVLLGAPQKAARYDPAAGEWRTYDLGMYPHSVASEGAGGVWFNGHFTKDPSLLARLDPATGEIEQFEIPASDQPIEPSGPIPYEIRAAPNGMIWGSELAGNRVYRFDPATGTFATWTLPLPHSGPRRLDVADDGTVWIPEYAGNALTKLDPASGQFTRYPFPTPSALPYVARVDPRSGRVWVGTAGSDAVAVFDPATQEFLEIPLPTRGALIRHLVVDAESGSVWASYSPGPAVAPKVVRIDLAPSGL